MTGSARSPAITLYGYPVSNYVNIVRSALIEKGLSYTLVPRGASQDEAFLNMSAMGKIPVLGAEGAYLAESVAILEYLDDRFPEPSLRPQASIERARARQIVNVVQMYVEAPARSLFPGVFMGGENASTTVAAARATLNRSTAALARLVSPGPYLFGPVPTSADLFAFYNLDLVDRLSLFVWGRSIMAEARLEHWATTMRARESTAIVMDDFERCFAAYLEEKGAAYRPAPAAVRQSYA